MLQVPSKRKEVKLVPISDDEESDGLLPADKASHNRQIYAHQFSVRHKSKHAAYDDTDARAYKHKNSCQEELVTYASVRDERVLVRRQEPDENKDPYELSEDDMGSRKKETRGKGNEGWAETSREEDTKG
ncbi:hypothetical protein FRC09_004498 [Ceratobasidium sp. 395]|nr:hypothetical protein FRC09_004498 [Ceratobasidium sp. 395]